MEELGLKWTDKLWVCNHLGCIYSAKRKSDALNHSRTHSGLKPFSCRLCGYKSAIKSNVLSHLRNRHSGTFSGTLGANPVQWPPL